MDEQQKITKLRKSFKVQRHLNNHTMQEACDKMGLTVGTVYAFLNGYNNYTSPENIGNKVRVNIAAYCELDPERFLR